MSEDLWKFMTLSKYATIDIIHTSRQTEKMNNLQSFKALSDPPRNELVCRSAHFVFSIAACTLPVGMWQSLIPQLSPNKRSEEASSGKHTQLIKSPLSACMCLIELTSQALICIWPWIGSCHVLRGLAGMRWPCFCPALFRCKVSYIATSLAALTLDSGKNKHELTENVKKVARPIQA